MDELQRLQEWYASQCNQDWEHSFGIKIGTVDNPGWTLEIDLRETDLEGCVFEPVTQGDSEVDSEWLSCKVEHKKFMGACGANSLTTLLQSFLEWAEANAA